MQIISALILAFLISIPVSANPNLARLSSLFRESASVRRALIETRWGESLAQTAGLSAFRSEASFNQFLRSLSRSDSDQLLRLERVLTSIDSHLGRVSSREVLEEVLDDLYQFRRTQVDSTFATPRSTGEFSGVEIEFSLPSSQSAVRYALEELEHTFRAAARSPRATGRYASGEVSIQDLVERFWHRHRTSEVADRFLDELTYGGNLLPRGAHYRFFGTSFWIQRMNAYGKEFRIFDNLPHYQELAVRAARKTDPARTITIEGVLKVSNGQETRVFFKYVQNRDAVVVVGRDLVDGQIMIYDFAPARGLIQELGLGSRGDLSGIEYLFNQVPLSN